MKLFIMMLMVINNKSLLVNILHQITVLTNVAYTNQEGSIHLEGSTTLWWPEGNLSKFPVSYKMMCISSEEHCHQAAVHMPYDA